MKTVLKTELLVLQESSLRVASVLHQGGVVGCEVRQ